MFEIEFLESVTVVELQAKKVGSQIVKRKPEAGNGRRENLS